MTGKNRWVVSLFLVLMLVALFLVIGCSQTKEDVVPPKESIATQEPEVQELRIQLQIAMGTPGGTWQSVTEGVAQAVRLNSPAGSRIEVVTGSIGGNPVAVQEKKVDLAIAYGDAVKGAIDGVAPYDTKNPDLRVISSVYVGALHFIVPADSPINSFKDIKEKQYPIKMSINTKGSTPQFLTEASFNQYGITLEDIVKWGGDIQYLSSKDAFPLLTERRFNMGLNLSYLPSTVVMELASSLDIKLLSLDDNVIKFLNDNYGTVRSVIPAGTYTFQDRDVITVGSSNLFVAHKDMPDEIAYKIVEAIDNQRGYLEDGDESFKGLTLQKMFEDMGDLPVHPGALKYYNEHGVGK